MIDEVMTIEKLGNTPSISCCWDCCIGASTDALRFLVLGKHRRPIVVDEGASLFTRLSVLLFGRHVRRRATIANGAFSLRIHLHPEPAFETHSQLRSHLRRATGFFGRWWRRGYRCVSRPKWTYPQ